MLTEFYQVIVVAKVVQIFVDLTLVKIQVNQENSFGLLKIVCCKSLLQSSRTS